VHALAELPAGSVVETYGFNVYQPQFDGSPEAPYRVERVGKEPENKRSRVASLHEVVGAFAGVTERKPTAIVMNQGFVTRFLPRAFRPGEAPSDKWLEAQADQDAVNFFRGAVTTGIQGFHVASNRGATLPDWLVDLGVTPVVMHDYSTGQCLWLFVRDGTPDLSPGRAVPAR
jgi:hypothetical protein